jgi:hypothetical protein
MSATLNDSNPAQPVEMSIESDPPAGPLALSFDDEPRLDEPKRPPPAAIASSQPKRPPPRATASSFLLAWSLDAALVCGLTAACAFATLRIGHVRYPFDFLRDTSRLWILLAAAFWFAWSLLARALPQLARSLTAGRPRR